jgi:hypothetical protein
VTGSPPLHLPCLLSQRASVVKARGVLQGSGGTLHRTGRGAVECALAGRWSVTANGQYGPQSARTLRHPFYNWATGYEGCWTLKDFGYPGDSG